MGSNVCMNELCCSTTSSEWKKGWGLKSGGFAILCYSCGSAYEKVAFCETFHLDESGWKECRMCRKRIHCGCIASKYLFEYMDLGGIVCLSCARILGGQALRPIQIPNDDVPSGILAMKNKDDTQTIRVENRMDENILEKGRLLQLGKSVEAREPIQLFKSRNDDKIKREEPIIPAVEVMSCFPNLNQQSLRTSVLEKAENCIPKQAVKDAPDSFNQPSLNFSLSTPISTSSSGLPFPSGVGKVSPFQQGQKPHHILPKPPKAGSNSGFESKSGISTPTRVARPPAEGRGGRNQLLPRYWPRITDQELQKLSGDLKSTIVPLFEKVLSASDAGRIGRLVLPKACAEAYFPYINHSEGIPIRMQDIKGKEWTFQFRFWPNNNSRMYVLEGVTPCIQNMQLQAGDTVTFSRIDPEGKLVMGFRKATNNAEMQVSQNSTPANGGCSTEIPLSGATDNHTNGGRETDKPLQRNVLSPEKKKVRNIGCKNKRLLMHSEDAMELRITWEEAQELLRPPPTVNPTIVVIENHEFEEYDEPPVFGKRTIFTSRSSGEHEQWAQCDNCSKWRRLPVHVLLPANWTCSDNVWDSNRCSCSAPNEMNQKELDAFLRVSKETKRRRIVESSNDGEPSGLDALATVAVLGESMSELGEPSAGATTKHPRHRPGCSCIVCIQPPSGKGKHEATCKCNVCLTVKRRFKTLMQRKKKKQSERELELAQGKDKDKLPRKDAAAANEPTSIPMNHPENEAYQKEDRHDAMEEDVGTSKGQLDLNCHPNREDDMQPEEASGLLCINTGADTDLPSRTYNLAMTTGKCLLAQTTEETKGKQSNHPDNNRHITPAETKSENEPAQG
ncbi:PREDICTED: B3 domain-containing transcription repressor VAL1-like isoform X2 [Ipomoea nil]|uniref:B3 domain-containing transcription repressor VAL1-like isoform X2 n=1 Tax=Ipomoea nil TaxID=35883 RepID=UPI000900A30F|nr:PREDICTED: B3 domain-containing transcription repressor VAL1-like isoform X2 [Ipomoea nil]